MSQQDTIRDDISYMRKLAESGRRGQILGGIFLAVAGVVFGIASFASYAVRNFGLQIPGYSEPRLWIGANAVFWIIWVILLLRFRSRAKQGSCMSSAVNATFGVIWAAMAAGVMTAFGATLIVAHVLKAPVILNAYIPVIYAFYGTAWIASAALAKRSWMYLAGVAALLFAFVMAMLSESPSQALAMTAGLFLLLAVPGFKLVADETRS